MVKIPNARRHSYFVTYRDLSTLYMFQKKLILASKSPRRKQLLEMAGIPFEIKTKEVEESYPADLPAKKVAPYLAQKKARACQSFIQNDEIILAADSVVILGETIYGKPKDRTDALHILGALSGKMHLVITGICLLSKDKELTTAAVSKVYFETLSETEIEYYVDKYQPYDKAGAYAIQEWIGLCKISKIEGTYSNIMGLPMELVYKELLSF